MSFVYMQCIRLWDSVHAFNQLGRHCSRILPVSNPKIEYIASCSKEIRIQFYLTVALLTPKLPHYKIPRGKFLVAGIFLRDFFCLHSLHGCCFYLVQNFQHVNKRESALALPIEINVADSIQLKYTKFA